MKRSLKSIILSCFIITCIIVMAFLPLTSISAKAALLYPTIRSFSTSANKVKPGDTVTLSWNVSQAKKIEITGLEKNSEETLSSKGQLEVWPTATTTYTLTCTGYFGITVKKSITVVVQELPKIISFTATETEIEKGTLVTLNWETINAANVKLVTNNGIELLARPQIGKISVTPNRTSSFTLIATNESGVSKQTLTISVK